VTTGTSRNSTCGHKHVLYLKRKTIPNLFHSPSNADKLSRSRNVAALSACDELICCETFRYVTEKIFNHARKSIDRLQHVNDDNLIPKNLIISKNKEGVASVVYELIVNDEVYGQFDQPTDDEPDYGALVSETAAERMHRVMYGNGETVLQLTPSLFPMNERRDLLEVNQRINHNPLLIFGTPRTK